MLQCNWERKNNSQFETKWKNHLLACPVEVMLTIIWLWVSSWWFSLFSFCFPCLLLSLQSLPNRLHVLPVLADGHRRKVELVHWFGNRLQACDGSLFLPVKEDVACKDGRRHKSKDDQDQPDHTGDMRSFGQVLNSLKEKVFFRKLCVTYHEWRNFLHSSSEGSIKIEDSEIPFWQPSYSGKSSNCQELPSFAFHIFFIFGIS